MSLKGATLADLMSVAASLHFVSRPVKVELDELGMLTLPAILHWDFNHFVVLTRVGAGVAVIHDPGHGERHLKFASLSKHFTGVALELTPMPTFQPRSELSRISLRALLGNTSGA